MQKILVAEDQSDLREMIGLTLSMAGYQVNTAPDGEAALREAAQFQPDLIILDVHMPGLSGCQVCAELQKESDLQRIPVLLMSGQASNEEIHTGLEAGAQEYIRKPFELNQLIERVGVLLSSPAL
jgi:DNA-binding response OmpR family regulator